MNNFLTRLSLQEIGFNILMYLIILVGGLVALLINMLAHILNQLLMHRYVVIISAGTMAGGALCHYFLKMADSYVSLPDVHISAETKGVYHKYKNRLTEHRGNKFVVGVMNGIIILIFLWVNSDSMYQTFPNPSYVSIAAFLLLLVALGVFARAKNAADKW